MLAPDRRGWRAGGRWSLARSTFTLALAPAFALMGPALCGCSSAATPPQIDIGKGGDAAAETGADADTAPPIGQDAGDDGGPDSGSPGSPDVSAVAIAVGGHHACALTGAGGVVCWGDNRYGQLGDGTQAQRVTPVAVGGLTRPVRAIAAGDWHTCALDATGTVLCWGSNTAGALGDGSAAAQRAVPGPVAGVAGVVALAASGSVTCVATAGGSTACWGANGSGQLGDGTMTDRGQPAPTSGVLGGAAPAGNVLGPGGDHTCIVAAAGSVVCAGDDTNGALGNGGNESTQSYVSSGVTSDAIAVASGVALSCALLDDGTVQCWGFGGAGGLGDGALDPSNMPVPVTGLAGVTGLAVGLHHACAVTAAGASCWGDNSGGSLGDGTMMQQATPVAVLGLPGAVAAVAAVATGGGSCALTVAGAVYCWGENPYGEVGDGTTLPRGTAVPVVGLP